MNNKAEIIFNVIDGRGGAVAEIILNRPKALNALSLNMCIDLNEQLIKWAADEKIKAVIIKSSSKRAFCAGGDIRKIYEYKIRGEEENQIIDFFRYEYQMNTTLHHFPKPYIAFLDGITMGGGAGVSLHGSHPIATEHLIFAMPETAIGFFPDVGSAHFFKRCPGKLGSYLALTGSQINADTAASLKLVKCIIPSEELSELQNKLLDTNFAHNDFTVVTEICEQFSKAAKPSELLTVRQIIDDCFSADSLAMLFENLSKYKDDFAQQTLELLKQRSPTSLQKTLAHLSAAQQMDFDGIMKADYELAQYFLHHPDFIEGIRAAIIDKDNHPNWQGVR